MANASLSAERAPPIGPHPEHALSFTEVANRAMLLLGPIALHPVLCRLDEWYQRRYYPDHTLRITQYFARSFDDSEHLLRGMATAPFILAGCRALEFFVQDSCTDQDAWDFYTYFSPSCVGIAMKTLSECGVVWEDALQPLRDMCAGGADGDVKCMHIEHLAAILARAEELEQAGVAVESETAAILEAIQQQYEHVKAVPNRFIRLASGVSILIIHDEDTATDDAVPAAHAVVGYTTFNSSREKVRLIFKPDISPMEYVLAFAASSLQCSITAFGAIHLYYDLAVKRQAILWRNNRPHSPADHTREIYKGRAWRVVKPSFASSYRITDSRLPVNRGSKFFAFDLKLGLPNKLYKVRKWAVENLKWEVSEEETRLTRSEPRSLRRALAWRRDRRRSHHASTSPAALVEARKLAFKHSVAFNAGEDAIHPNEVSGV